MQTKYVTRYGSMKCTTEVLIFFFVWKMQNKCCMIRLSWLHHAIKFSHQVIQTMHYCVISLDRLSMQQHSIKTELSS